MTLSTNQWLMIGAGLAVLGLVYQGRKTIATKLNPASRENIVYEAVNSVGDQLDDDTDNNSFSLGGWIYDIFHPYDNFELDNPQWDGISAHGDLINRRPGIAE